ncbi:hypothetical protein GOB93_03155 [Acetobacter musti]|uniref:Uncharacterized protein n=1 Tax=Acetobacter musti TaxID=864732 RepID=A0ABX0JLD2_9PROT|nr:hypothetical protein [Acetobacter musti]NHN83637.1 hypothetical protein [Acetobacter musti]
MSKTAVAVRPETVPLYPNRDEHLLGLISQFLSMADAFDEAAAHYRSEGFIAPADAWAAIAAGFHDQAENLRKSLCHRHQDS